MGHLNGILARVGGNLNNNFRKSQMPGGLPGGGMLRLRFDRYITTLVGLRISQQVRHKHSEVLDARNLKRIVNNLQRKTCLSSELLAKNKRKKMIIIVEEKKNWRIRVSIPVPLAC